MEKENELVMHSNNVFQYSKIRTRKRNAKKSIKTVKNWNPALFGIRNPLCWNPESSTRNPESTAWNIIQNPRMSWLPLHGANRCPLLKQMKRKNESGKNRM